MKIATEVKYILHKKDYELIREELKKQKITVKSVIKDLNLTKNEFYDQAYGRKPACRGLLELIDCMNIAITFEAN